METTYELDIAHLKEIDRDIEIFLKKLKDGDAPKGKPTGNFLTQLYAADSVESYFNARANPDDVQTFQSICSQISSLPYEYKKIITGSLHLIWMGISAFERWAEGRSAPHPSGIPDALQTLRYGVNLIANETLETREFRKFYLAIHALTDTTKKAVSGTNWTTRDTPREDVPEYNEQALRARDAVRAQFERLDENYLALMNERLLQYKPTTLAESLAPMDDHDDPEKMEIHRTQNRAYNKEILEEAAPYQAGERTIRDIINLLQTEDFIEMNKLAVMASMAANLYYSEVASITFDCDKETGAVSNLAPPQSRVLQ